MRYAYPCIITRDENDWFTATFPDIPEAGTDAKTRHEALTLAEDALAVALAGYVHERRDIPLPGTLAKGQHLVPLPPVVAAKLALHVAMRTQGVTEVTLADRMGISKSAVRKLANPDNRSHIGQVENALKLLGRALVIEDRAA